MCGIAGVWLSPYAKSPLELTELTDSVSGRKHYVSTVLWGALSEMSQSILHRGPDDLGFWFDKSHPFALCHRRLSILELGPFGHQPMHSSDGLWVISFNGEIYNHQVLRRMLTLEGRFIKWKGGSDTETLVECIAAWGLHRTLKEVVGMFAVAAWDVQKKRLLLARDRFGEKPLYFGWNDGRFAFASELKAIRNAFDDKVPLSADALGEYFTYSFIPAPLSVYKGVYKLFPGHYCVIDQEAHMKGQCEQIPYWSLSHFAGKKVNPRPKRSEPTYEEAKTEFVKLLTRAVSGQMQSEVPLGAFLSGGLDSSAIVALMASLSSRKVRTFTVSFDEVDFDEGGAAAEAAMILGTEHTDIRVGGKDLLKTIYLLPEIYDEPFGDSSQVLTCLISKVASREIKVALTGDGGDELLGGYHRHYSQRGFERVIYDLPPILRSAIVETFLRIPSYLLGVGIYALNKIIQRSNFDPNIAQRKIQEILLRVKSAKSDTEYYSSILATHSCKETLSIIQSSAENYSNLTMADTSITKTGEKIMYFDSMFYLPDDILCKVDRASMAFSLETRAPFLDKDVVEYAWALPFDYKINRNRGKRILRDILRQYLPNHLVDRGKHGFVFPLGSYLRGPLKAFVEEVLSDSSIRKCQILSPFRVRELWRAHLDGKIDYGEKLWTILMFVLWHQRNYEN